MPRAATRRGKILLAMILIIVAVIVGVVFVRPPCKAEIVECCLTTSYVKVKISGSCEEMTLRIVDKTGTIVREISVRPGENLQRIDLPTEGEYCVELRAGGRMLDTITVETSSIPAIIHAKALLKPGQLLLTVESVGLDSCLVPDFNISSVTLTIFYANGTYRNYTFTGPFPPKGTITLDVDIPISAFPEIESAYTIITDSLGRRVTALTGVPR